MELQDVFWSGFADEVEKIAVSLKNLGKGALVAGGLGVGAKALAGGDDKPKKSLVADTQAKVQGHHARMKAQMEAAE